MSSIDAGRSFYEQISLLQNSHGPRDIRPVLLLRRGDPAHDVSVVQPLCSLQHGEPRAGFGSFRDFRRRLLPVAATVSTMANHHDRVAYTGTRRQRDNAGFNQAASEDCIKPCKTGR